MSETTGKQVAVVTGASLGLGRALAAGFAHRGLAVAGIARDADRLAGALAGLPVHAVAADVGDPAAVAEAFRQIRAELGDPTILVNNAAIYPRRDILDETPESFMATVDINLGGAVACCHEALPEMVRRGRGRIVNVATFADVRPAPMSAAYSVSKGAMRILTRSLVADLGDRFPGIVVNDWIPGALKTRMGLEDGIEPETAAEWGINLALMEDPALNGLTFERDREHVPPVSAKQRLKALVLGQSRPPVRLDRPPAGRH